ncbi:MAG: CoA-transferase, partial [Dehalococcoidia bacterium]|nr:CoA-transferase [Dehalococcoidia bacterium]
PRVVVTDLGTFRFDPATREMTLATLHPGVTVEQAQEHTGWPLRVSPDLTETTPPDAEALRVVRMLDPTGHFLNAVA